MRWLGMRWSSSSDTLSAMKPLEILGRTPTPDGGELVLYQRDGVFSIRIDGLELMSSRAYGSEKELARRALVALGGEERAGGRTFGERGGPRVLVGGLGMGYTTRAALDCLPPGAEVVVAELLPIVVEWNRGPLAPLAGHPLDDRRTRVVVADVTEVAAAEGPFNAILLDTDNGPSSPLLAQNRYLYTREGLARFRQALAVGGVLAVWSADPAPLFLKDLRRAGFTADCHRVAARPSGKGPHHAIFLARRGRQPSPP